MKVRFFCLCLFANNMVFLEYDPVSWTTKTNFFQIYVKAQSRDAQILLPGAAKLVWRVWSCTPNILLKKVLESIENYREIFPYVMLAHPMFHCFCRPCRAIPISMRFNLPKIILYSTMSGNWEYLIWTFIYWCMKL